MNEQPLLLFMCIALWKLNQGMTTRNLSFFTTPMSWKSAANFCLQHQGVLESNSSMVLKEFRNIETGIKDAWFGKYESYSQPSYLRGCFLIQDYTGLKHFTIGHYEKLECQTLCEDNRFFTFQDTDCYCMDEILSFEKRSCNCIDCYIWEHQHIQSIENQESDDECIAVINCAGLKIKRKFESCELFHNVTCDNDINLGFMTRKDQVSSKECKTHGSFIKWYPDDFCLSNTLQHPFWTSGRRYEQTFYLKRNRDTTNTQLLKCFKVHRRPNLSVKEDDEDNCLMELPFFCSFGSDADNIATMSPKNSIQSDMTASIAAGTITSIIVVFVVILFLLFNHRRRQSNKGTTRKKAQNHNMQNPVGLHSNNNISQAPVYHESERENCSFNNRQTVNNIAYDLVNSNKTVKSHYVHYSPNHYIQTNFKSIEKNRNVGEVEGGNIKEYNDPGDYSEVAIVGDYSLARPITEESDPYGIHSDYDHLNNVKKKEDPITKVYDHLPTKLNEDPTYDHSNLKSVSNNDEYYDHFKIN